MQFNGEMMLSASYAGIIAISRKMDLDHYYTQYTEINLKRITNVNYTTRLLREKINIGMKRYLKSIV